MSMSQFLHLNLHCVEKMGRSRRVKTKVSVILVHPTLAQCHDNESLLYVFCTDSKTN